MAKKQTDKRPARHPAHDTATPLARQAPRREAIRKEKIRKDKTNG